MCHFTVRTWVYDAVANFNIGKKTFVLIYE